jgi:ribosomal protein S18 acetylase RimI-like enzyme
MVFEIRPASVEDWAAVRSVRLRALSDAPTAFASRIEDERDRPASAWRERLASNDACTFLAVDDGEVVGIVAVFLLPEESSRTAHLVSMWVAPGARRTGVATEMIDSVVGWADQRGAESVELWVTETNEPARRLYKRYGFVGSGERQKLPSDRRIDEIQMRLDLAAHRPVIRP